MKQQLNDIRCTSCSAPLCLLGNNQRAKTLICQYCDTVMDCKDDFRALYSFNNVQKPQTALRIGMQGLIDEVAFQVSGFVVYRSAQKGREAKWLHFQCYSPTHGYSHIISTGEQYLVLRRTHYLPDRNIWMLKQGDQFAAQGNHFVIDQFYFTDVFYAAGNITEVIQQRQRTKQCFAYDDERCFLSIQRSKVVEYYSGAVMPLAALEVAFKANDLTSLPEQL